MKLTVRSLAKSPGFTVIAVAMLALGIGASTACFSLLNAFFLRPPPFARPAELVSLHTVDDRTPGLMRLSYPNYRDFRQQSGDLADLAFFTYSGGRVVAGGQSVVTFGLLVSANYFELLGVNAALGRVLRPADDNDGAPSVVVVSHAFWKARLGGDPAALGRPLVINGTPFTIVGVTSPEFRGVSQLDAPEFWLPSSAYKSQFGGPALDNFLSRRAVVVYAIGRLKPGVSRAQLEGALKTVAVSLAKTYPAENGGRSIRVIPIREAMLDPNARADMLRAGNLLIALSGLILLIACANLANLLLVRAAARQREIALRVALGASRRQVVGQLLQEHFLLAALGGLLGVLVAYWLRDLLWLLRPRGFSEGFAVTIDGGVIAFAVVATLVTGLLFGLMPALSATRVDLVAVIKRDSSGRGGVPLLSFRNLLVAAQVALSVVALVIAGLFVRSLQRVNTVNLGWNSRNLALLSAGLGVEGYDQPRSLEYYQRAMDRLRTVPGVVDVSLSTRVLLTGVNPQRTIRPQGTDETLRTRGQFMSFAAVLPGYLAAMRIPIVAGRDFVPEDDANRPPIVIVNETFARRFWPGESPLGKKVKLYNSETLVEIVGVTRDIRDVDIKAAPEPFAFFPLKQAFAPQNVFHIRTAGRPEDLQATLRKELQAIDPAVPIYGDYDYDDVIRNAMWGPRTGAALMSAFGGIALVLAALGIYAVMAHSVGQRTREIGIRVAIGAQAHAVVALVLRRGVVVAGTGVLAGLAVALAATRYISGFLFEVDATDPVTFAAIALLLGAVALLACYVPARRATKIDPLIALRTE